jgi:hypothetical protein
LLLQKSAQKSRNQSFSYLPDAESGVSICLGKSLRKNPNKMRLSERQKIEILMMVGYEDRIRIYQEVCNLFNQKYSERLPITRSTVSQIET